MSLPALRRAERATPEPPAEHLLSPAERCFPRPRCRQPRGGRMRRWPKGLVSPLGRAREAKIGKDIGSASLQVK